MSRTDEDRTIQMITKLLEKGGTMLATHHECGAPMFRYQGRVLCPVCDYQEKQEKMQEIKIKPGPGITGEAEPEKTSHGAALPKGWGDECDKIAIMIRNKIRGIAESLENETDLERVKGKMECIELGVRILKLLKG